ncbi:MAG: tail fiber domain-containing protein, partial [Patescibacteria group bacterium]
NPGVWTCASDARLKYDVSSIEGTSALAKLTSLNPVMYHFNWQDSDDPLVPGFIAQEMEEIFPNMVSTNPKTGYKSLSYTPLIPYAIKAIQELNLKVESLTNPDLELIDEEGSQTFVGRFFARIITWFGDAGNGIGSLFADRVNTKEICVSDEAGGETCITKTQLDQLLFNAGASGGGSGGSGDVPPPEETCSDGIQNQDETGIDTGGVCDVVIPEEPPAEETCSDGIQNQDETGIDTGGVCEVPPPAEEPPAEEPPPEPPPVD